MKGINDRTRRVIPVVILLVPVFLFLFLRYCGVNHYAVPVFYSQGVDKDHAECSAAAGPYRIRTFPFTDLHGIPCDTGLIRGKYSIFTVADPLSPGNQENIISNIQRALDDVNAPQAVQCIEIMAQDTTAEHGKTDEQVPNGFKRVTAPEDTVSRFARCGLLLPPDSIYSELVLVDDRGRIRGYYQNNRFEEIDRLVVETKILLKEEYKK